MDTKFIGLDGFDEIEPISGSSYTPQKSKSRKTGKPQHASFEVRGRKIDKKKVTIAAGTALTAVLLSCFTVAGALGSSGNAPKKEDPVQTMPALVSTVDEASAATADEAKLCGLYVDGKLIGVTPNRQALEKALKKVLDDYKKGYDAQTTTSFANSVEVRDLDEEESKTLTAEELVALGMDKFSINLATDYIYTDETDYDTDITYDDSKPASYQKVVKEGKKGITEWTVRYTFTDGEITDSEITGSKVKQELQNEEIVIGTGAEETDSDDYDYDYEDNSVDTEEGDGETDTTYTTGSSGSFIWPLPHTHNITSLFEWRWGRMHNGIDIAGGDDYGQPIIAADSGTVTWSGNDGGGYGNYVTIDHGNGYTTVYGHASELACVTGQYVNQGDVIAYVGSTGNSTGPHLHFEIQEDGTPLDPLGFVS